MCNICSNTHTPMLSKIAETEIVIDVTGEKQINSYLIWDSMETHTYLKNKFELEYIGWENA